MTTCYASRHYAERVISAEGIGLETYSWVTTSVLHLPAFSRNTVRRIRSVLLEALNASLGDKTLLSSAAKPGTHFLENNKITGVFKMLKLCVSKERYM